MQTEDYNCHYGRRHICNHATGKIPCVGHLVGILQMVNGGLHEALPTRSRYAETAKLPAIIVTHEDNVSHAERHHAKTCSQAAYEVPCFVDYYLHKEGRNAYEHGTHPADHKEDKSALIHLRDEEGAQLGYGKQRSGIAESYRYTDAKSLERLFDLYLLLWLRHISFS